MFNITKKREEMFWGNQTICKNNGKGTGIDKITDSGYGIFEFLPTAKS